MIFHFLRNLNVVFFHKALRWSYWWPNFQAGSGGSSPLGLGPPPGPPPGLPQHCILAPPPPGFYNNWPHPFLPFSFFSLPREASKFKAPELFWTGYWGKVDFWCRAGTKNIVEPAMFHKMLIFKAGIDFSSLGQLPLCLLVFSSFTLNQCLYEWVPKRKWFLTRNRFCGIDLSFFAHWFLKEHLHHSLKMKSHNEVT